MVENPLRLAVLPPRSGDVHALEPGRVVGVVDDLEVDLCGEAARDGFPDESLWVSQHGVARLRRALGGMLTVGVSPLRIHALGRRMRLFRD